MPKLHLILIKQELQQLYSELKKKKEKQTTTNEKNKQKNILNIHHRHAIPPLVKISCEVKSKIHPIRSISDL